jgi:regulator of replication initiation timing
MAIPIFGEIERLITEHGSAAILKEHVTLLKAKLDMLKDEFSKLEKENSQLKQRVSELERQVAGEAELNQFVEERGALFKRKVGDGYHNAVYCPRCHKSTSPFPPGAEFNCVCGWASSFTEDELPRIISRLPET